MNDKSFQDQAKEIFSKALESDENQPLPNTDKISQESVQLLSTSLLRGDLDNIILMALRKEPSRRYLSVAEFSDDIDRYLKGLPVIARPNTFSYRTEKFIKRNLIASIIGGLFILSLLSGIGVSLWQAREARRERDRAIAEQNKTESVNRFMSRILQAASPDQMGKDAKIIEVLNDAEQNIETEFANQPEQKAQAYLNLGLTYEGMQNYTKAVELLNKSLQICEQSLPIENTITSAALIGLGWNYISQIKYDEAGNYLKRGIEMESKVSPNGSRTLATGLTFLADLEFRKGKLPEANKNIDEALTIFSSLTDEKDIDYAFAVGILGRLQFFQGDLVNGEANLRKSISILRSYPKKNEVKILAFLLNLGILLTNKKEFDEAIKNLNEGDVIAEKLGIQTFKFFAKNYLCNAYGQMQNLEKIIEVCPQAIKLFNPNELQEGIDNVYTYNFLGIALTRTGKPQEGEVYLRKSLALMEKISPNDEVFIAIIKSALGESLLAQNKLDEAKPLIEETYPIIKAKLGDQHKNTIGALKRLVTLYEKTNNTELANKYRAELPQ